MSLGITEIILILVVVLVLFGGRKIPELARGLGKAQAEYKKAKEAIENEIQELQTNEIKASHSTAKKNVTHKAAKKNITGRKVKKTTINTSTKKATK